MFSNTRPDDMLAHVLKARSRSARGSMPARVDDVIVGCAMPEAEQGMNVARIGLLLAGFPDTVSGHDHQPLLFVRAAGGGARRRPHPPGRGRRDDRRRHREHEHGADGRQQDRVQPGDLREGRERRHRLRHGHHRREGRRSSGRSRARRRTCSPPRAIGARCMRSKRASSGRDHALPIEERVPDLARARLRSAPRERRAPTKGRARYHARKRWRS
jgi:hypothetical protein